MWQHAILGSALLLGITMPARAQMDVQRQVWRCGAAAQDQGLTGRAAETFVDRCLAQAGVGGPPPTTQPPAPRSRPAPAAAGAQPAWQLATPSSAQVSLRLVSNDRAFTWSFDCTRNQRPGGFVFTTFFTYPPRTEVYGYTTAIVIDDTRVPIEVDGSEGGVVLSNATADNTSTLSPPLRQMLAEGNLLRIPVRQRGGPPREAVFNLAGGRTAFADFERRCRSLR